MYLGLIPVEYRLSVNLLDYIEPFIVRTFSRACLRRQLYVTLMTEIAFITSARFLTLQENSHFYYSIGTFFICILPMLHLYPGFYSYTVGREIDQE